MGLPMQALNMQVKLTRWHQSQWGLKYTAGLVQSMGMDPGQARGFAPMFGYMLDNAATYAVSTDIARLLREAEATLPDFNLHVEDVPNVAGFVFFEETQMFDDVKGRPLAVKAIGWQKTVARDVGGGDEVIDESSYKVYDGNHGIAFVLFTDGHDERDSMHDELSSGLEELMQVSGGCPPLWGMAGGRHAYGESAQDCIGRIMYTFFRFIQETWVDNRMVIADRHTAKRVRKYRITPEVRVIQLREASTAKPRYEDSGEEIHYSHRFIVSGHWRNQWYPSQDRHAPKYIPSYIKGPDDKPLIIRDRVFHVAR